ncbi:MAG: PrgI family protein [Eubacteriales bacterium]|nr:PrgI family protein [Eubacteriales bacterium]
MIEVRIPKEVREYQEKWLLGMTKRQLTCCLLALVVNVPLYFFLQQHLGDELAGWAIVITSAPFILVGFYKYNGMNVEKLALCILDFMTTEQNRKYMTNNVYAWIKSEYEKEGEKNANNKGMAMAYKKRKVAKK